MQRGTRRSAVELFDLVREVLLHDAAAQLEGRRDLAAIHLEVPREDREPLDLLEARAIAVDVVDDARDQVADTGIVGK
jgi:hypothetical protein